MNKKSGLSLASMVLYVVLFFIFMTFAIAMSSNLNYKTLTEKGTILNQKDFEKLQYNLVSSANESEYIDNIQATSISFSNGDIYTYDDTNKTILKNGGTLVRNVMNFNAQKSYTSLLNVSETAKNNINQYLDYVLVSITFEKYDQKIDKQIFVTAKGDDFNET